MTKNCTLCIQAEVVYRQAVKHSETVIPMPLLYQAIRCPRQVLNPEYEIRLLDEITVHEFLTPEDGVEKS